MKKDIFETFVSMKSLTKAMQIEFERRYPIEAKYLKNIFGGFLFAG